MRPEVEFAVKLVERAFAEKVPDSVSDQLRIEVEARGNAITILECRPPWREDFGPEWTRHGVARFKFSPSDRMWRVYWMRRDLKFHLYDLIEPQAGIGPLIAEVDKDPHACFWG